MSEVTNLKAVATGATFCKCGGMMIKNPNKGLLLSDPPKVEIYCPFCGEKDYVNAPYEINIQFKKGI